MMEYCAGCGMLHLPNRIDNMVIRCPYCLTEYIWSLELNRWAIYIEMKMNPVKVGAVWVN